MVHRRMNHPLRVEYERILRNNGLAADYAGQAALTMISDEIHNTLAASGIALPCPVYVGQYPALSFNAHARMVDGGALILVNLGFQALVYEIMSAFSLSVQSGTRQHNGAFSREVPKEDFSRQEKVAYDALADALLAYVNSRAPSRPELLPEMLATAEDWRTKIVQHQCMAVVRFAVAHEFGHVLASHLNARLELWEPRGWHQELEADQLGALLLLNHMEKCSQPERSVVASGPFLFFAVDHLITRVRNEIVGIPHRMGSKSHPPSDERAAALRGMFAKTYGPSTLHVADACVRWLSWREESILASADRLLRTD